MATIENLEKRVTKIEMFIYEIIREKFNEIDQKLGEIDKRLLALHEKTEKDKTELI